MKIILTIFLFTSSIAVELGKVNRLSKFTLENMRYLKFKSTDQPQVKLPAEQWYNQSLDHFDLTNRKTWMQVQLKSSIFKIYFIIIKNF
jgi:hypothetical protein